MMDTSSLSMMEFTRGSGKEAGSRDVDDGHTSSPSTMASTRGSGSPPEPFRVVPFMDVLVPLIIQNKISYWIIPVLESTQKVPEEVERPGLVMFGLRWTGC
jgi:hypothetical protein